MALVMCSVTDKNMPVVLAVLLRQNGKNTFVFPNYAKNVLAQSIKAYWGGGGAEGDESSLIYPNILYFQKLPEYTLTLIQAIYGVPSLPQP